MTTKGAAVDPSTCVLDGYLPHCKYARTNTAVVLDIYIYSYCLLVFVTPSPLPPIINSAIYTVTSALNTWQLYQSQCILIRRTLHWCKQWHCLEQYYKDNIIFYNKTVYAYALERSLCKVHNPHLAPALCSSKTTHFVTIRFVTSFFL